jgi:hypothetical protein
MPNKLKTSFSIIVLLSGLSFSCPQTNAQGFKDFLKQQAGNLMKNSGYGNSNYNNAYPQNNSGNNYGYNNGQGNYQQSNDYQQESTYRKHVPQNNYGYNNKQPYTGNFQDNEVDPMIERRRQKAMQALNELGDIKGTARMLNTNLPVNPQARDDAERFNVIIMSKRAFGNMQSRSMRVVGGN